MLDANWFNQFFDILDEKEEDIRKLLTDNQIFISSDNWDVFYNSEGRLGFIIPAFSFVRIAAAIDPLLLDTDHINQIATCKTLDSLPLYLGNYTPKTEKDFHIKSTRSSYLFTVIPTNITAHINTFKIRVEFLCDRLPSIPTEVEMYCLYLYHKYRFVTPFHFTSTLDPFIKNTIEEVYQLPPGITYDIYLDNKLGNISYHVYSHILTTKMDFYEQYKRLPNKKLNTQSWYYNIQLKDVNCYFFIDDLVHFYSDYYLGIEISDSDFSSYAHAPCMNIHSVGYDALYAQHCVSAYLKDKSGSREQNILNLISLIKGNNGVSYSPSGVLPSIISSNPIAYSCATSIIPWIWLNEGKPDYIKYADFSVYQDLEDLRELHVEHPPRYGARCSVCMCPTHYVYEKVDRDYSEKYTTLPICSKKCLDEYLANSKKSEGGVNEW